MLKSVRPTDQHAEPTEAESKTWRDGHAHESEYAVNSPKSNAKSKTQATNDDRDPRTVETEDAQDHGIESQPGSSPSGNNPVSTTNAETKTHVQRLAEAGFEPDTNEQPARPGDQGVHAASSQEATAATAGNDLTWSTTPVPIDQKGWLQADGTGAVWAGEMTGLNFVERSPSNMVPAHEIAPEPSAENTDGAAVEEDAEQAQPRRDRAVTSSIAERQDHEALGTPVPMESSRKAAGPKAKPPHSPTDPAASAATNESRPNPGKRSESNSSDPTIQQIKIEQPADEREVEPATARARKVDASIKLENATGQPARAELSAASETPTLSTASTPSTTRQSVQESQPPIIPQSQTSADNTEDDQRFPPQMVRGLTAMLNQRGGVMTMRLDPPDLGEVRVQMTLHQGTVAAEFQASTTQAQALLEKHMTVLRHALEGQGLTVDRLSVQISPSQPQSMRDDNANNSANQGQSQQRFGHDAAGGESRGRHEQQQQGHEQKWRSADFSTLFDLSVEQDLHGQLLETGSRR